MTEFTPEEKKIIQDKFEEIFEYCKGCKKPENEAKIRKAFDLANKAHYGVRRRSGEPYIHHPIEVAQIVAKEIGLGTKSVISALLHDVVEDTEYTIEDIERLFGPKIANIIDGLTKISGKFDAKSLQAENYRKMLLTLSNDVRVIFVKLADRLHNMRTLDSMPDAKKQKIASETLFIYAPLAHRLGLYAIKTELEDLSLKHQHPKIYEEISNKIKATEKQRIAYINKFSLPIINKLTDLGIEYSITGRPKSVYSIWNKMNKKGVPFEEIYDLFAVRIVYKLKDEENNRTAEKRMAWNIYSVVTDIYRPKPDRLRDWVSLPKANGYEALHTTVMGPGGKWVEVQIRSERMDEIAERGYAAHWKYKGNNDDEGELDKWIKDIKKLLETPEDDALEFLDQFRLNLFSSEIYVFTPKGQLRRLPKGATALDFAYDIHSEIGNKAIGAKINHKLYPLSKVLESGDQVEIITSDKQTPQAEWLDFVVTARAKSKIKDAFKHKRKEQIERGRALLEAKLKEINVKQANGYIFRKLLSGYQVNSKDELYRKIGAGEIDLSDLRKVINKKSKNKWIRYWTLQLKKTTGSKKRKPAEKANYKTLKPAKNKSIQITDNLENTNFKIADCCNPIPGDEVMGYIADNGDIIIHKKTCPKAKELSAKFGDRIVTPEWKSEKVYAFLASIQISGIDKVGMLHKITGVISTDLNVNMRSLNFNATNGVFEGKIDLYVYHTSDINELISKLIKIDGVKKVNRIDAF